jgi:acid stress-induced BolA-like protein IbaG/YrbA
MAARPGGATGAVHTLDYGPSTRLTNMDPRDIAQLIEQHLPGATARVHTDGQGHYEATVVCAAFAGKRSLQRHQMVYGTLGTRVGREIHALALETFTPEEWQARSA